MLTPTPAIQNSQSIRDQIGRYQSGYDPKIQLNKAEVKRDAVFTACVDDLADLDDFNPATIHEFTNGFLMCETLYPQHKTFAIEMMRQLQEEYGCKTVIEKMTCEVAILAYIRILENKQLIKESLEYQQRLAAGHTCGRNNVLYSDNNKHTYFGCNACNRAKIETQKYTILTKELDRAYRQYYSAIQELRLMKQTPLSVTIRANTAVIGNQHAVQVNSHE